jgi:uncharacterized membrane protein
VRRGASHLVAMLLLGSSVLLLGAAQKAPCASQHFAETGSGPTIPCYTDLSVLLRTEQLGSGRVPYLDACVVAPQPCDEYPVLTMFTMFAAARVAAGSYPTFYWGNVLAMLGCALLCVWALERMRARTVLFAAAPALALYGTLNWDLLAVAATTVATYLLVRRRDLASGVALGIGAAAKLYPAIVAVPFAWQRWTEGRRRDAWRLVIGATATWALVNAPFAFVGTTGWLEVFRFNGGRGADFESVWTAACQFGLCASARVLNVLIPLIVIAATALIWRRVTDRYPAEPRWFLAFPMLIVIVVTGKFWSPQYALWLLPWFALSRIPVRVWLAYQLSEVLEFVARSGFMMDVPGSRVSLGVLSVTVVLRAVLLLRCLVVWMRDPSPAPGTAHAEPAPALAA